MTSKQYYEQTSKMAYRLDDIMFDEAEDNKIVANIALTHGEPRNMAENILTNNDFFSISEDAFEHFDTDSELELEIRFHYGIDDVDCYKIDVCDIIDCTGVEGGRVVLSCEGYELVKKIRPMHPIASAAVKKQDDKTVKNNAPRSIFDLFDDFAGWKIPSWTQTPYFPSIPDWTKTFEDAEKRMKETIESVKNCKDGDSKFYNFSCKIDPDGKVHIKRSSNDGTVEKEFMLGDKSSESDPKKIEADDPKTELRNLVK